MFAGSSTDVCDDGNKVHEIKPTTGKANDIARASDVDAFERLVSHTYEISQKNNAPGRI